MRPRYIILAIVVFIFHSCSRREQVSPRIVVPKAIEAKGYVVPQDSISEPVVVLLDGRKLKKIPIGKPQVVLTNTNVHPAGIPKVVVAGKPRVCTPGQDTFLLPGVLPAVGSHVIAGIPEVVIAKDPSSKDQNPHNFSAFSKQQGLKNAFVSAVIEDRRGNLWIGHGGGVTKYDGRTFANFAKQEGLSDNAVFSILEDMHGNLWFSTFDGVSVYDGKSFTQFNDKEGLSGKGVITMHEDKQGNLWFGAPDGLSKYDGKSFTRFTRKEGLLDNQINHIIEDRVGNLWLASEEGVSRYDGTSFFHFTDKEGLSHKIVNHILEDREGNLWFGTFGGGLNKYDGRTFTHFTEKEGLFNNQIYVIFQDKEGSLWLSSHGAVNKYDGKTFTHFTESEGLSNTVVYSILEDRVGNLWFGTQGGGVSKYDGELFYHFTENEGLTGNEVASILQDDQGRLWLCNDGGISRYDENALTTNLHQSGSGKPQTGQASFTNFTVSEGLSSNAVRVILKDQKANLWIGTIGGGVNKYIPSQNGQPATITYLTKNEGLLDDMVFCLLEDQDGNIWIGTNQGVSKYTTTPSPLASRRLSDLDTTLTGQVSLTNFTVKEGLSGNAVHCMLEDQDGNIWFGTYSGGVTKYDPPKNNSPASFTHFTEKEGFQGRFVRSIMEDHEGNIWFGTDPEGVIIYTPALDGQPASFTRLTEREGLSNNAVLSILEDRDRNLWFGTRMGLSILTSQKRTELFDKVTSDNIKESDVFFKNYTYENGFLGVGCTVNSILEDANGIVWIGANDRLTACDPRIKEAPLDSIAPNIQLTGIALFNEFIAWTELEHHQDTTLQLGNGVAIQNFRFDKSTKWYGLPEDLSLAYNNNYLTFSYVGITMHQPKKVKYQYILEGNDEHWSAITTRTEAPYGNLPHGSYTFKVKAMNSNGYWSDEVHYRFQIRPPWWLTWWAYGSYAVLFLSLMYFAQRYQKDRTIRAERVKADQKQAILNERLRISRDLHDEVGATLSGIAMYSHIAKEQNKSESRDVVDSSLTVMQESAGDMVTKLSDIVWLLNPDQAHLKQLVEKLEEYARQMAKVKDIHVTVDIAGRIGEIELPIEVRRNIYLICKEAINNAVKYSKATTLDLLVRDFDHSLEFIIQDNGVGFNIESVKKGNGLENMKRRAQEIGSKINLSSSPGHGTKLILHVNLTH